jgi:hypothetical protein
MGDNPTAGGAGDVTWTLREILFLPVFQTAKGPELYDMRGGWTMALTLGGVDQNLKRL